MEVKIWTANSTVTTAVNYLGLKYNFLKKSAYFEVLKIFLSNFFNEKGAKQKIITRGPWKQCRNIGTLHSKFIS